MSLFSHKPKVVHTLDAPLVATALTDDERPYIIKLRGVEKVYDPGTPRETNALKGVNLDISLAEIVVIFGPSGSGKSTLLNILAGLDNSTGGTVEIDGLDLAHATNKQLAEYHQFKVGMVFQAYNLVDSLTVMQNITMPARLAGFKRSAYMARGHDLLKSFELEKLAHKLPSECSGGQQQRVGIMRAFMNRPSFIIADEPTGNLDSISSTHIMKLFQSLNRETNTTILIVTHDPTLFEIADRVVLILDGKVVKQTILTKKAKIDPKTAGVPVEFKLRAEDKKALIDTHGGAKTADKEAAEEARLAAAGAGVDGAAKQAAEDARLLAARRLWLEDETRRIADEEREVQAFWRHVRTLEARVQQRAQRLEHERSYVYKEGRHLAHERSQILVAQVQLGQRKKELAEVLRRQVKAQLVLKRDRMLLRMEWRKVAEREASMAKRLQKQLASGWKKLTADQVALEQAAKHLMGEQEKLNVAKQELAVDQKNLIAEQMQLAQASVIGRQEQRQLETDRAMLRAKQAWLASEQKELAREEARQNKLQRQLAAEQSAMAMERTHLEKREAAVVQHEKTATAMRAALNSQKAWLDQEKQRVTLEEDQLAEEKRDFKTKQAQAAQASREQEREAQRLITLERQKLAEAEAILAARQADEAGRYQAAVQEAEARLREAQRQLEQERGETPDEVNEAVRLRRHLQAQKRRLMEDRAQLARQQELLQEAEQAFVAKKTHLERALELQISMATDILDHEKEQIEAERHEQVRILEERGKITERRLAAARQIVDREASFLSEERRLLEIEREAQEAERRKLAAERKKLDDAKGQKKP